MRKQFVLPLTEKTAALKQLGRKNVRHKLIIYCVTVNRERDLTFPSGSIEGAAIGRDSNEYFASLLACHAGVIMRRQCVNVKPCRRRNAVNCAQSRALHFVALRNADSLKRTSFDFPADLLSITTSRLYLFVAGGTYRKHAERRGNSSAARHGAKK